MAMEAWVLPLLRCPWCMSNLALDPSGRLTCGGCAREYDVHRGGTSDTVLLMRGDGLATLAQDVVVFHEDPDSTRRDRRAQIRNFEERERFLAALTSRASARSTPSATPPSAAALATLERFAALLPADAVVLDPACGRCDWSNRLTARGLRVLATDSDPPATGPTVAAVQADMMEMPFATGSFDGIWCSEAFDSVRPDRRTVFFRQVHRVLKPGGIIFVSASTAAQIGIVRHYLLWRYLFHRPVVFWEHIEVPRHGRVGPRYQAMASARTLRTLCREHSFRVLSLQRDDSRLLLLARKAE